MNIITGYRGEAHITAQQVRDENMGIVGTGSYILQVGQELFMEQTGANEITISDGILCMQGCMAEIPKGTTETINVPAGTVGMMRTDAIVARYTKNNGGVEDVEIMLIEGTPDASSPSMPSIYDGASIANGDTSVDFLLATVSMDGANMDGIFQWADKAASLSNVETSVKEALSGMMFTKRYDITNQSVAANSFKTISPAELGVVDEPGYKIAAILGAWASSNDVVFRLFYGRTEGNVIIVRNVTNAAKTTDIGCVLLWVKEDYLDELV